MYNSIKNQSSPSDASWASFDELDILLDNNGVSIPCGCVSTEPSLAESLDYFVNPQTLTDAGRQGQLKNSVVKLLAPMPEDPKRKAAINAEKATAEAEAIEVLAGDAGMNFSAVNISDRIAELREELYSKDLTSEDIAALNAELEALYMLYGSVHGALEKYISMPEAELGTNVADGLKEMLTLLDEFTVNPSEDILALIGETGEDVAKELTSFELANFIIPSNVAKEAFNETALKQVATTVKDPLTRASIGFAMVEDFYNNSNIPEYAKVNPDVLMERFEKAGILDDATLKAAGLNKLSRDIRAIGKDIRTGRITQEEGNEQILIKMAETVAGQARKVRDGLVTNLEKMILKGVELDAGKEEARAEYVKRRKDEETFIAVMERDEYEMEVPRYTSEEELNAAFESMWSQYVIEKENEWKTAVKMATFEARSDIGNEINGIENSVSFSDIIERQEKISKMLEEDGGKNSVEALIEGTLLAKTYLSGQLLVKEVSENDNLTPTARDFAEDSFGLDGRGLMEIAHLDKDSSIANIKNARLKIEGRIEDIGRAVVLADGYADIAKFSTTAGIIILASMTGGLAAQAAVELGAVAEGGIGAFFVDATAFGLADTALTAKVFKEYPKTFGEFAVKMVHTYATFGALRAMGKAFEIFTGSAKEGLQIINDSEKLFGELTAKELRSVAMVFGGCPKVSTALAIDAAQIASSHVTLQATSAVLGSVDIGEVPKGFGTWEDILTLAILHYHGKMKEGKERIFATGRVRHEESRTFFAAYASAKTSGLETVPIKHGFKVYEMVENSQGKKMRRLVAIHRLAEVKTHLHPSTGSGRTEDEDLGFEKYTAHEGTRLIDISPPINEKSERTTPGTPNEVKHVANGGVRVVNGHTYLPNYHGEKLFEMSLPGGVGYEHPALSQTGSELCVTFIVPEGVSKEEFLNPQAKKGDLRDVPPDEAAVIEINSPAELVARGFYNHVEVRFADGSTVEYNNFDIIASVIAPVRRSFGGRSEDDEAIPRTQDVSQVQYLHAGFDPMPGLKQGWGMLIKGFEWLFKEPQVSEVLEKEPMVAPVQPAAPVKEPASIKEIGSFEWPGDGQIVMIGRSSSSDVIIMDLQTSKFHARVITEGGRHFIEDCGSKNGTFVNDERIGGRVEIKEGDEIRVGNTKLSFIAGKNAEAASVQLRPVPKIETRTEAELRESIASARDIDELFLILRSYQGGKIVINGASLTPLAAGEILKKALTDGSTKPRDIPDLGWIEERANKLLIEVDTAVKDELMREDIVLMGFMPGGRDLQVNLPEFRQTYPEFVRLKAKYCPEGISSYEALALLRKAARDIQAIPRNDGGKALVDYLSRGPLKFRESGVLKFVKASLASNEYHVYDTKEFGLNEIISYINENKGKKLIGQLIGIKDGGIYGYLRGDMGGLNSSHRVATEAKRLQDKIGSAKNIDGIIEAIGDSTLVFINGVYFAGVERQLREYKETGKGLGVLPEILGIKRRANELGIEAGSPAPFFVPDRAIPVKEQLKSIDVYTSEGGELHSYVMSLFKNGLPGTFKKYLNLIVGNGGGGIEKRFTPEELWVTVRDVLEGRKAFLEWIPREGDLRPLIERVMKAKVDAVRKMMLENNEKWPEYSPYDGRRVNGKLENQYLFAVHYLRTKEGRPVEHFVSEKAKEVAIKTVQRWTGRKVGDFEGARKAIAEELFSENGLRNNKFWREAGVEERTAVIESFFGKNMRVEMSRKAVILAKRRIGEAGFYREVRVDTEVVGKGRAVKYLSLGDLYEADKIGGNKTYCSSHTHPRRPDMRRSSRKADRAMTVYLEPDSEIMYDDRIYQIFPSGNYNEEKGRWDGDFFVFMEHIGWFRRKGFDEKLPPDEFYHGDYFWHEISLYEGGSLMRYRPAESGKPVQIKVFWAVRPGVKTSGREDLPGILERLKACAKHEGVELEVEEIEYERLEKLAESAD